MKTIRHKAKQVGCVIALAALVTLTTGCGLTMNTNLTIEDDLVINNFDGYIVERFGVTPEVYAYTDNKELHKYLQGFMKTNIDEALPEEVKELSYHILNKYPNYIGTQEERIHTVIAMEYVITYLEQQKELNDEWDIMFESIQSVYKIYEHVYNLTDTGDCNLEELMQETNDGFTHLQEEGFYGER